MVYRFEKFEFDDANFRLSRTGEPVALEPKALRLLLYLIENRNRLVRKQELLDYVWPEANVGENALARAIGLLRKALDEDSRVPRFIETVPTLGYRFIAQVTAPGIDSPASEPTGASRLDTTATVAVRQGTRWRWILAGTALAVVVSAATYLLFFVRPPRLTGKDTIVLADFTNSTGDPVFDETLRQGLAVQLEQSPFLSLVSEERIRQVLKLMEQPADARLTPAIAREICERTSSAAVLDGSIAALGSQYVLGLRTTDCSNGQVLADEQVRAVRKEDVLGALDEAASKLRSRLGESLASVEKFDTPLAEATTPSLEALKAFSQAQREMAAGRVNAARPLFQRAVELDPNFARGYQALNRMGGGRQEEDESARNIRKAYELRGKVSERERLSIEAAYYQAVTGETEKAISELELWKRTYPRDIEPYVSLGVIYRRLGDSEKGLEEHREALRRGPESAVNYQNVASDLVSVGRLDEAKAVYKQAEDRNLVFQGHAKSLYLLAFLQGDSARMAQLTASEIGSPGTEDLMLFAESDTEAWYGRLHAAKSFTRRAMNSAENIGARETAGGYLAEQSIFEADVGEVEQARIDARTAVKLAPNRDVQAMASLALVRAGDVAAGENLAEQLDKKFPVDTLAQRYWLPAIHSAAALARKDPARAAELLGAAQDFEFTSPPVMNPNLAQIYLHGYAYLALHDGRSAAAEFQKYIDRRSMVRNSPWGPLGRLGLARAYAMQGDKAKARTAYRDFLTLWKDADPDIPILRQAQAEYAKLQ